MYETIPEITIEPKDHAFVLQENGEMKPYNEFKAGHLLKRVLKEAGCAQGMNELKLSLQVWKRRSHTSNKRWITNADDVETTNLSRRCR